MEAVRQLRPAWVHIEQGKVMRERAAKSIDRSNLIIGYFRELAQGQDERIGHGRVSVTSPLAYEGGANLVEQRQVAQRAHPGVMLSSR